MAKRVRSGTTLDAESFARLPPDQILALLPVSLAQHILSRESDELEPWHTKCDASLLLIDISGFSTVALQLEQVSDDGAEALTEGLNAYFTRLLGITRDFGGDVVLFSGDAVLAAWFAPVEDNKSVELASLALRCANELLAQAGSHSFTVKTISGQDEECHLGVHCGAAHGPVTKHLLGGSGGKGQGRWKFVVAGAAVEQAGVAANLAKERECVATSACFEDARRAQVAIETTDVSAGYDKLVTLSAQGADGRKKLATPQATKRLLSLAPQLVFDSAAAAVQRKAAGELRTVSVVFLKLCAVSAAQSPEGLHGQLASAVKAVQKTLSPLDGVLNKVVMDDKGFVLLCLFGLPLHTHEDDAERAVAFGHKVSRRLHRVVGPTAIGIARAKVFCGMSGAKWRNEYTVLGDGVNIAARLMIKAEMFSHGKVRHVICDDDTARLCQVAKLGIAFAGTDEIVLKGRAQSVLCHHVVNEVDQQQYEGRLSIGSMADCISSPRASSRNSLASSGFGRSASLSSLGSFSRSPLSSPGHNKIARAAKPQKRDRDKGEKEPPSPKCTSPRQTGLPIKRTVSEPEDVGPPARDKSGSGDTLTTGARQASSQLEAIPIVRGLSGQASQGSRRSRGLPSPRVVASGGPQSLERGNSSTDSPRSSKSGSRTHSSGRRSRCSSSPSDMGLRKPARVSVSLDSSSVLSSPRQRDLRRRRTNSTAAGAAIHGRENEVTLITSFLTDPESVGRSLVISGDMQQGKSVLLRRAFELGSRGHFAVIMYPTEATHSDSYASIAGALQRYASVLFAKGGEAVRDVLPTPLRSSAPLLHHVVRVHGLPLPNAQLSAMEPSKKLATVADLCVAILSVCARSFDEALPLLFVVDDAQWLDSASAGVVAAGLRGQWAKGSRAVVAIRKDLLPDAGTPSLPNAPPPPPPPDLDMGPRRSSTVSSEDSSGLPDSALWIAASEQSDVRPLLFGGTCVALLGLPEEAHRDLLIDVLKCSDVAPELEELLRLKGGGAAGLSVQMAAALRDTGAIQYDSDLVASAELNPELDEALVHAVPSIEATVMRSVDTLAAEHRAVINAAAVIAIRNSFCPAAVGFCLAPEGQRSQLLGAAATARPSIAPASLMKVADSLERLQRHGMITADGPQLVSPRSATAKLKSLQEFRFARPLFRDVVYFSVLAKERRELHRAAAQSLAVSGGPESGPVALMLHMRRATVDHQVAPDAFAQLLFSATQSAVRRGSGPAAIEHAQELRLLSDTEPGCLQEEKAAMLPLLTAVCHYESGALPLAMEQADLVFRPGDDRVIFTDTETEGSGCLCCFRRAAAPQLAAINKPASVPKSPELTPWELRVQALALRAELCLWAADAGGFERATTLVMQETEGAFRDLHMELFQCGVNLALGKAPQRTELLKRLQSDSAASNTVFAALCASAAAQGAMQPPYDSGGVCEFMPLRLRSAAPTRRPAACCTVLAFRCAHSLLLGMTHDLNEAVAELSEQAGTDPRWKSYSRVFGSLVNTFFFTRGSMSPTAIPKSDSVPDGDKALKALAIAAGSRRHATAAIQFDDLQGAGTFDVLTPVHCAALYVFSEVLGTGVRTGAKEHRRQSRGRNDLGLALARCVFLLKKGASLYPVARPAAAAAAATAISDPSGRVTALRKVVTEAAAVGAESCGIAWRARAAIAVELGASADAVSAACLGLPGAEGTQRARSDLAELLVGSAESAQCERSTQLTFLQHQLCGKTIPTVQSEAGDSNVERMQSGQRL
eukprot:TRINITY_DN36037_c0_g1_i1.p1 TRINITY_DN36037_c0_g1~~TRINITY_DN36037_c0_g1_i1.p1  ORF type:complete len:1750 (+),score=379.47 TRINITY_DN36037_c0_g1_i1:70-5319(+)